MADILYEQNFYDYNKSGTVHHIACFLHFQPVPNILFVGSNILFDSDDYGDAFYI